MGPGAVAEMGVFVAIFPGAHTSATKATGAVTFVANTASLTESATKPARTRERNRPDDNETARTALASR